MSVLDVFGLGGPLAARFPGYVPRDGQIAMAKAVEQAIVMDSHFLVEAPTGTGKSLAYGAPATEVASRPGRRAVIVTANIALQEQLIRKDLPLLAETMPWSFDYALLKGINNYVCVDKIRTRHRGAAHLDAQQREQLDTLVAWAKRTRIGDVSELPTEPAYAVWQLLSSSSDECKGKDCELAGRCFGRAARDRARKADVIVTNYHLLFAHLAVRAATGQDIVLPPLDVVVLDEAHKATEIAREFFGFRVSFAALRRLARPLVELGHGALAEMLEVEARAMCVLLAQLRDTPTHRVRLREPGLVAVRPILELLAKGNKVYSSRAEAYLGEGDKDEAARLSRRGQRCATIAGHLLRGISLSDPNLVVFVEKDRQGLGVLRGREVDVGPRLSKLLFGAARSVVTTSATLTTAGAFDLIRRDLGAENARELMVGTPFDYGRQALLVVPDDMPDPTDPAFPGAVAVKVLQAVELARGRTLALFTSYRNLDRAHALLKKSGYRVLRQSEAPRTALVERFRADVDSVLLGTESFWAGVDVPGPALSCVVIDRLPFPSPDDPVLDAIKERDPRWFLNHGLPRAVLAFKQGFGRLIRSAGDHGVVVVLDRRIIDRPYGRLFLNSLPSVRRSRRMEAIAEFLGLKRGAA